LSVGVSGVVGRGGGGFWGGWVSRLGGLRSRGSYCGWGRAYGGFAWLEGGTVTGPDGLRLGDAWRGWVRAPGGAGDG